MSAWVIWKLLKLFAVVALVAGVAWSAGGEASLRKRWRGLIWTTWGLFGAWVSGYMLLRMSLRTLATPWVVASLVSSLMTLHAVAILAHAPAPRRAVSVLAWSGLLVTIALMSVRSASALVLLGASVPACVLAFVLARGGGASDASEVETSPPPRSWFRALALAEGGSLVLMVCVSMPLRRLTGVSLDAGSGLLAWAHGVLFLLYLQALASTARVGRWPARQIMLAILASLVPFGTLALDRWLRHER